MAHQRSPQPAATYRVQFTRDFTFRQAAQLADYWHALGVTDLYASPFLRARPGSSHGYDVVDHRSLNPEIGTEQELATLHAALSARGIGLIMDIVPNHMCVNTNENRWWNDVLENGPSSPYAKYFDIDWRPAKLELRDKVLLPVLGDHYGKILEDGQLRVGQRDGAFFVQYHEHCYPIAPSTYPLILELALSGPVAAEVPRSAVTELESIMTAARHLPAAAEVGAEQVRERQREKEVIKRRLAALLRSTPAAQRALDHGLEQLNGQPGDPASFDRLDGLLGQQAYRLSFWRVAGEQINYRRFFEINDLAAIRVEEPEVFDAVHATAFELLRRGWVTGLRIDHVDGLREPRRYLERVATEASDPYVVVEKILAPGERLPRAWATEGTTGYDFLALVNGVLVARAAEGPLRAYFDRLRLLPGSAEQIVIASKRLVIQGPMASELSVLSRRLARLAEQHRWSRDFTIGTLERALADVIACFPVYRTYVDADDAEITPQDTNHVRAAVAAAQDLNNGISASVFSFLADVLLLRDPEGTDEEQRSNRREFLQRFQQLTGPVMAKGLEDTAFYRDFPLLSLNEVGAGPGQFGLATEEFHRLMEERARERPGALSATSTHDTKRGEDSRARLNVLSEMPERWTAAVDGWRRMAERMKTRLADRLAPDADDEYYIYQTLVGAWPLQPDDETMAAFRPRAWGAIEKAIRESKRNTTWINPNLEYEAATRAFVERALDPTGPLMPELAGFVRAIAGAGIMNSISQLVLKVTAPGIPDFFQGTEWWDLSMVDPDNRRPVDFTRRRNDLAILRERAAADREGVLRELCAAPHDARIKLLVTHLLLTARREHPDLFARGSYRALDVTGERRDQVVAFLRRWQTKLAVVIVGRCFADLPSAPPALPQVAPAFAGTSVSLPIDLPTTQLRDAITGRILPAAASIPLDQAFRGSLAAIVGIGDIGAALGQPS